MVENYLATKVEVKKDVIKVYYRCAHCHKVHSHGALPQEVITGFIHRGSHCHLKKGDVKITL